MQNRYVGDIGDFVKFGLLRALCRGQRLGIAWYLFSDETHNSDGKDIEYLEDPSQWRHFDPELFDSLKEIVSAGERSVRRVEASRLFHDTTFSSAPLDCKGIALRKGWFENTLADLQE